jgi:hypothetical protein
LSNLHNTAVENSLLQQAEKRFENTPQNPVIFMPVSKAQKSLKFIMVVSYYAEPVQIRYECPEPWSKKEYTNVVFS